MSIIEFVIYYLAIAILITVMLYTILGFFPQLEVDIQGIWYDLWLGFYYDRTKKILYFSLIPTFILSIKRRRDAR